MNSFNFERASKPAKKRKRLAGLLAICATAGVIAISSTLAANLNLNTGHPVEFGQGVSQATACTGTDYLTVTANAGYVNGVGSTDFKLTSFSLSHIPNSCWGKTFLFQVHDVSGPAILINATSTSVSAIYEGPDSSSQDGSVTGATGENINGSYGTFTFSLTSPVALATNVAHLFVQSVDKDNWKLLYKVIDPRRNPSNYGIQYASGYGLGDHDAAANFLGKASQIRYRMELNFPGSPVQYADVKFTAPTSSNFSSAMLGSNGSWTATAQNLQIPAPYWGVSRSVSYVLQANVTNLSVQSNMPGVVNGSGFLGRLEIWPGNYTQGCSGLLDSLGRSGDCGSYDWDDSGNSDPGYGSFQVANISNNNGVSPHIIFAWNRWYDSVSDIGFGTDPMGNPDWTFDESNGQLLRGTPGASWNLQIFVK